MLNKKHVLFLILLPLTININSQTKNLDYYLKLGLQNSPLLNDYRNQVNSAEVDSLIIRAAQKPFVEGRSQLLYSPSYHNFGYDEVITDGGNYTAVLGVTQKIFNRKELDNKYEAANLVKKAAGNSTRISVTELTRTVTNQYLTAYTTYSDLMFNRNFLDLFHKENEIVQQFVKNGVGKQTDYLSLLVETQSQEILVNQLQSQYRQDLMLLNQICGINDSVVYELSEPQILINGSVDIRKVPAFIKYKIDSLKIANEKIAVDIRYKPKINWFADAGFLTSNPWNFYQHFGYSIGISLNVPVYDGKQRDLEKRKLEFDENSRNAYENNYRTQYIVQLRQLNDELKALNEISSRLENQLKTSDLLVRTLKDQLEAGIIQMTEYINAIKNDRSTGRALNMINIQKIQVINEMNFLLTK
jgi:outer membrane protein TolC